MISKHEKKRLSRLRRHRRVRAKVRGSAERPRIAVFRSTKHISAQVIDDAVGKTLAAASDAELGKDASSIRKGSGDKKGKTALAYEVGKKLAEKAKAKGITKVVFDRGGFAYRGRIAALAEGARENGLEF
jgi:large subunit ribosomal protein L18